MTEKGEKNKRGRKTDKRDSLRERISEDLRNGVFSGKLPGLNVLAQRYGASPATVQRSLRELSALGFVDIRPRSGTYVKLSREVNFVFFEDHMADSAKGVSRPSGFQAEYGILYDGLHDTLRDAGVVCQFYQVDGSSPRFLNDNALVVALFTQYVQEFAYRFLENTNWIRVMGAQDYNCPGGHITYDNLRIGRMAVDYLASAGCRRIACIGSPRLLLFRQRIDSVLEECRVRGIEIQQWEVDLQSMPLSEICRRIGNGIAADREAIASGELGIFCCADHFMVPLRQEMAAVGLSPETIHHLSCDNNPCFLRGIYPPPAEIDIGMYRIGVAAAHQILGPAGQIKNKSMISPELILPDPGEYK